jgi:small subunit ribosomal protein S12e
MSADGVVKGLNQVGKSLDRADAFLCVLADDCDDPKYKKLITALAKQNKIPLINVPSRNDLGEWTGQCKYEKSTEKGAETGKARKIKGCSSLCIRDYGKDTNEKTVIEQYIKDNNL